MRMSVYTQCCPHLSTLAQCRSNVYPVGAVAVKIDGGRSHNWRAGVHGGIEQTNQTIKLNLLSCPSHRERGRERGKRERGRGEGDDINSERSLESTQLRREARDWLGKDWIPSPLSDSPADSINSKQVNQLNRTVKGTTDAHLINQVNNKNFLTPITTTNPIAPENVLKVIRCKCKSKKRQCETNVCTCRKNGIKCMTACGGCHGESCNNRMVS